MYFVAIGVGRGARLPRWMTPVMRHDLGDIATVRLAAPLGDRQSSTATMNCPACHHLCLREVFNAQEGLHLLLCLRVSTLAAHSHQPAVPRGIHCLSLRHCLSGKLHKTATTQPSALQAGNMIAEHIRASLPCHSMRRKGIDIQCTSPVADAVKQVVNPQLHPQMNGN